MKRLFTRTVVWLTAVLILAGCSGGGETAVLEPEPEALTEAVEAEVEVVDVEEAEVVEVVEETPTVEAEVVEVSTGVEHDKFDLSLIGNTGRPQFLNAYASW